jgi:hypothetical protein
MKSSPVALFLCTFFIASFVALSAHSGVYRVVDENGNVTFTDNPPADHSESEAVTLPRINTQPAPPPAPAVQQEELSATEGYTQVLITQPVNEATIPPGQQVISVKLEVQPALQPGHSIQLVVDSQPYGKAQAGTSFSIAGLERGEHALLARVLDENKQSLATSNAITIHVKRAFIKPKPKPAAN